jgi:hypothetical protein
MLRSFRTTKREGSSSLDSSVPTLASAKNENMGLNETFASSPRDHDGQLQEAKEKLDIPKTTSPANHQTESTYLVGMKLYLMLSDDVRSNDRSYRMSTVPSLPLRFHHKGLALLASLESMY